MSIKIYARYRLLAIDVDGTLVNVRDEMTPATREALVRVRKAGVHVVATDVAMDDVAFAVLGDRFALGGGQRALIRITQSSDCFSGVSRCGAVRELALIDWCGYESVLCGDTYCEGSSSIMQNRVKGGASIADELTTAVSGPNCTSVPAGIFTGFVMGSRQEMLDLEQMLKPSGQLATTFCGAQGIPALCELSPAGVTKWSGIRLADQWGIGEEESVPWATTSTISP